MRDAKATVMCSCGLRTPLHLHDGCRLLADRRVTARPQCRLVSYAGMAALEPLPRAHFLECLPRIWRGNRESIAKTERTASSWISRRTPRSSRACFINPCGAMHRCASCKNVVHCMPARGRASRHSPIIKPGKAIIRACGEIATSVSLQAGRSGS